MQQQRGGGVKSLMEIQAEEARKAHQQGQLKQQQYRHQQQQQQQKQVQQLLPLFVISILNWCSGLSLSRVLYLKPHLDSKIEQNKKK